MRLIVCGFLAAGLTSTPAMAQGTSPRASLAAQVQALARAMAPSALAPAAQAAAAAEPKKVTVLIGADVPLLTGYVFRGIVQEFNPKFTVQPYVDVGVAVSGTTTVNFGSWNSFHTGSHADSFDDGGLEAPFYETDFYASATVVSGQWKPGALFTVYNSPGDAFKTVYELAAVLAYDDSAMSVPMSPKIVLAFELGDNQADAGHFFGGSKGVYLEAGVRPTFKSSPDSSVTFAVPVKLGLSLKDYYEGFDGNGELIDNKFGYLQFGANASVPIPAMKAGSWEFHAGLDFFVFGENRKAFQEGDDEGKSFKPVLNVGFSGTF